MVDVPTRDEFNVLKDMTIEKVEEIEDRLNALEGNTPVVDNSLTARVDSLEERVGTVEKAVGLLATRVGILESGVAVPPTTDAKPKPADPPPPPPPPPPLPPPPGPSPSTDGPVVSRDSNEYGLSNIRAIGSINANSNFLRLDRNPGFRVDDWIIIPVGYEFGKGLHGTMGVGGSWPRPERDVDDEVALAALIGKMRGFASIQNKPEVYWIENTVPEKVNLESDYYKALRVPLAYTARIVNISVDGLTLAMSRSARVSVNNAPVVFDNFRLLQHQLAEPGNGVYGDPTTGAPWGAVKTPDGFVFEMPADAQFAISGPPEFVQRVGLQFHGNNAQLWAPPGACPVDINMFECPDALVRDLRLRNDIGHDFWAPRPSWRDPKSDDFQFPVGLIAVRSPRTKFENVLIENPLSGAISTRNSDDTWGKNIHIKKSFAPEVYLIWAAQWADSNGGGIDGLDVDFDKISAGLEMFGGSGARFKNVIMRNASFSSNSSGGPIYENMDVVIEKGCQHHERSFSHNNPIGNVNSNIANQQSRDPTTAGGAMINVNINAQGPIGDFNGFPVFPSTAISINDKNNGFHIQGGTIKVPDGKDVSMQEANTPGYRGGLNGYMRAIIAEAPTTVISDVSIEYGWSGWGADNPWGDPVQAVSGVTQTNVTKINRLKV